MESQINPELLGALAAQVVEIQVLQNAAYLADLEQFKALVDATPEEFREPLRLLAPPCMLVKSFDLSFWLTVTQEHEVDFSLRAFPVNLNYSHRHSINYDHQSRMTISVEQYPLVVTDAPTAVSDTNN